jgi:hypothetical protein
LEVATNSVFEVGKGIVRNFAHGNFKLMTSIETAKSVMLPQGQRMNTPAESWHPPIGLPRDAYRVRYAVSPEACWMMSLLLANIPGDFHYGSLRTADVISPVMGWWLNAFGIHSDNSDYGRGLLRTIRATRGGAGLKGLSEGQLRLVHAQRFAVALDLSWLLLHHPRGLIYAHAIADVFGLYRVREKGALFGLCLNAVVPYRFLNSRFKRSLFNCEKLDHFAQTALRGNYVTADAILNAPDMHENLALKGLVACWREERRNET